MTAVRRILGSGLRSVFAWLDRRRLPQVNGTLTLPSLLADVEVIRDRWGVPHIYASNTHDLFLAQGFVHAQDRLWQMELNRRTATGRLSELFGEIALETDRTTRTAGFHRLGQTDWANADDNTRGIILAYTEGVNALLQMSSARMPIEFTLLRHHPERWTPQDSMAYLRLMMWTISHAWYIEIIRARLIKAVGAEHAAELEIQYPQENPVTLPEGIDINRLDPDTTLQGPRGPFLGQGKGSNAWAISGLKTTTGKPFLCNDVHLQLAIPSPWYECHLNTNEFSVTGASIPGLPGVVIGHNAHIAWGITAAFTDCEDLFVEKFNAQVPHRYNFRGEWLDAQVIPESIRVKGHTAPHTEQVIITHHGPIISNAVGCPEQRLALNSITLRPCPAAKGWLLLNQARNWDDFVESMRLIEVAQLNVAYADVDGNIGYWLAGKVPVRGGGRGTIPVAGWTGDNEWEGEIPFDEMPHAFNPKQGYVVTCNNRVVPDDYPHFLGNVWVNGYRARGVIEAFRNKNRLSIEDFRTLQSDFTCIPGREFVKRLEGLKAQDIQAQTALDYLRSWDGQLTASSVGGALYEVMRHILLRNLLEPGLGKDLTNRLMGQGFHPLLIPFNEFYGHDSVVTLRMLDSPDSWWVVQAGGREAVLIRSLKQTIEWLRSQLGADINGWRWGKIHRASFNHVLGMRKPLDWVFSRGTFPIGGDADTLCQTGMAPSDSYEVRGFAPTFRQIVDMSDFTRSLSMQPPGQSGRLGSSHYDDLIHPWVNGEYHPMLWTREQVEREAEAHLSLKPYSLSFTS